MYSNKTFLFVFLFTSFIYPKFVPLTQAESIAKYITISNGLEPDNFSIESVHTEYSNNNSPLFYIINITEKGFVIVAADDRVYPLLGYSFKHYYSDENHPIQFDNMLGFFKKQIIYVIDNNINQVDVVKNSWEFYLSDNIDSQQLRNVDPLITSNWDQGHSWNDHCPEDNQGPGGNAYAGCVATATAMVMKYWNHPETGEGSHAYYHSDYGLISADFNTTYNWDDMPDNSPTNTSRKLLFHVGVSCEMGYGPSASGAWVGEYEPSVTTALKTYFKYNQESNFKSKDNYDESYWLDIVRIELDEGRPLVYKGYTADYSAGHAFVVDGYNGDYFHLNWGWSGSYNGNYLITNLSPGGYTFSTWQGAIFNLYPEVEMIWGCTDNNACNYDENANADNSSCEYEIDCFGQCGGDAVVDECGECDGDGSICAGNAIFNFGTINPANQSFDINFESDIDIAGFQFTITDIPDNITLNSLSGGFADDYGFTVSCSDLGIVIGFSFEGNLIPAGSGILTTAIYDVTGDGESSNLCLEDVIVSNENGNSMNMTVGECINLELCSYSGDINFDGILNVQDIVIMVNMVIGQEEHDLCNGDLNQDDIINIQDIIILINLVLFE